MDTSKVVSYSSLAAIIKDGYELVCLIVLSHKSQLPFLEPKLIPGHNSREFVIMSVSFKNKWNNDILVFDSDSD